MEKERLEQLRSEELFREVRTMLSIVCHKMAMPLYMAFWLCDLLYAPQFKWLFLIFRLFILLICNTVYRQIRRDISYEKGLKIALSLQFAMSFFITVMVFLTEGPRSPYYAGLNLVCVAMLAFIPWSRFFYFYAVAANYGLYYVGCLVLCHNILDYKSLAISSFFITGTVLISLVIRHFNTDIRAREFLSKIALEEEVASRDKVISEKTRESLKLAQLGSQFSPQVVHSIRSGLVTLEGAIHRSNICAIFIDIVRSTERILRIDQNDIKIVIGMFMEDTMKVLLKYDITIDKFLGDGVLAFSNDPVKHDDYIERTVNAAIEIRERIRGRNDKYLERWLSNFEVRIGLSVGFANVGFYGSEKFFRSYTAIGPVINLASRLCSTAEPNQILIPSDIANKLDRNTFTLLPLGNKVLKGFESDIIKVFEVNSSSDLTPTADDIFECPQCKSIMHIDRDKSGIFVFKCRNCNYVIEKIDDLKKSV